MNEYIKQAINFLKKTHTEIKIEYVGLAVNKEWKEKEKRCLYEITLTSPRGAMTFDFWDSIRNTEIKTMTLEAYAEKRYHVVFPSLTQAEKMQANRELAVKKKAASPSAYDILACLTKYDPGTFEDFCSDYGYNEDSRTAERIYFAVQKEYNQLARLFTPEQMEELLEIN
jgi:hypothetical protein